MASHLFHYLSFIFLLVPLLLIELVQGRTIITMKKENFYGVKNESVVQKGRSLLSDTKQFTVPYLLSDNPPLAEGDYIQHHATIRWPPKNSINYRCYGTVATLNVYSLSGVGANQLSATGIWVVNGVDSENYNEIHAGWQAYPDLYGDHDTHFYIHWTAGDHKRGCYNLDCEGFVLHKDSKYIPGSKLEPLSTIYGPQYELTFKISQDLKTRDWWLYIGSKEPEPVGYWPKSIFTSLAEGASHLQWGGAVIFFPGQQSPPMGSGLYPREGYGRAAFLKDVRVELTKNVFSKILVYRYEDQTYCYQVDGYDPYYYGGPGGCTS